MTISEAEPTPAVILAGLRSLDGVFMTDTRQRIVYWSPSAERILGRTAEETLGKPCYSILVGSDFHGHPFCRDACPVTGNARKGRPTRDYDVVTETPGGARKVINNSVLLWPREEGGHYILHVFRELKRRNLRGVARPRKRPATAAPDPVGAPLSRRETEVLRLAATGLRTADIANELGVSRYTARNQLSSVIRKLSARNRVEAIAKASEAGII